MQLRALVVCAALAAAVPAFATPQHQDATGLWIDPNEAGWGLNLFHQGTTVFAALFVYGPDGQPRWYTASNMVDAGDGDAHDHMTAVDGDLFEATGPWLGAAFDPSRVTRRKVGTMSIDLGNPSYVTYTIDGVRVEKTVRAFTWRQDNISGDYVGYRWQAPKGPLASGPEVNDEITIHIDDDGSTVRMTTIGTGPSHPACAYSGTRSQAREFVSVDGQHSCSGTSGPWGMSVDVTPDGIMGSFFGEGLSSFWARIGASRTKNVSDPGTGLYNDLWFPANESGWGLNILEQGDTAFGTLFVYDPQGKSHWYSASNLHRYGPDENDYYDYIGPLYESTGPYYGTSFNAAAVTRREVGSMAFVPHKDGTADLSYTVDGVRVMKTVSRYAFAKNSLSGTYIGHIVNMASPATPEAVTIVINDEAAESLVMDTFSSRASCRYHSSLVQTGQLRQLGGNVGCSDSSSGTFKMHDVMVGWNGFNGWFEGPGILSGKIEAVRTQVN